MIKKPFMLLLLLLVALPIPVVNSILTNNNFSTDFQKIFSQISSNNEQIKPYSIINANNALSNKKWLKSLDTHVVVSNLLKYNNRALISFFTQEERNRFACEAEIQGINVERILKAIPAIIINYEDNLLNQINFNNYAIKYTYPIGTYDYLIPMNIDVEFPELVELSKLREALEIDSIHDLNHTGYGVIIAILDSGLNTSRVPALDGLLHYDEPKVILDITPVPGLEDQADFSGHGTHVATILAGNGKYRDAKGKIVESDNYGIAPDAQLINIKVLNQTGYGKDEWLIIGMDEAINQAPDLISASLTSITFSEIGDPIEELVYEAARNDILIVASAGNYGPSGGSVGAPAIWDHVISVGASDGLKDLAIFTSKGLNQNFSAGVDILAPGIGIQGNDAKDGGFKYVSGTSVSAPIVSGVLSLLISAFPGINIHKYETAILETATDLHFPIVYQGSGIINPFEAFNYLNLESSNEMFTIIPKRISPENQYYYSCVEGETTEFTVKLISSTDGIITTTVAGDNSFIEIASVINVYAGWNHFKFNISIPIDTPMRDISATIVFENVDGISTTMNINIQTRYFGGTVLFDISHENDTENRWFDASSPYGTHMYLTRILKDRGFHIRSHFSGNYDFSGIDILVISDPELNFTSQEIDDVFNFVSNGGSLLFLVDSIRFVDTESVEGSPIISSNYYACDEFLTPFNITVFETVPINVPYEVYTTKEATMFTVKSFMFWGKMLHFTEDNNPNDTVVAQMPEIILNNKKYVFNTTLAKEINNGRLIVFGSGYPFTDYGLLPDTLESNPGRVGLGPEFKGIFNLDANNNLLVNETFEWLIGTHRPELSFESFPEEIMIRQSIDISIQMRLKNGTIFNTGESIFNATLLKPDHSLEYIELDFNPTMNTYETTYTFTQYGDYFLFIPLKLSDYTPTDGRIRIFNNVPLWDALPVIETATIWISALIIFTFVLIPLTRSRLRKSTSN